MTTPAKSELYAARERLQGLADGQIGLYLELDDDLRLVLDALKEAESTVEAQRKEIEEYRSGDRRSEGHKAALETVVDLVAERDALKEQLDRLAKDLYAENVAASELRVERDALKAEVAKTVGEVIELGCRNVSLSAKLSASEVEVERLRDALGSRDLMIETLQRALGPDKVMEAFGFDHERIANARRQLAEGKFITLDQLKDELKQRAALRGEEASRE